MNKINLTNQILNFSSVLLCLIPFALITGPFFSDLFLVVIVINCLLLFYLNKDFSIFKNYYFYAFVFLWLILTLNSIFTQNIVSFKSIFFYLRFLLFSLAVFFLISKKQKILEYLLLIFLLIYFIFFIDTLYQFIFSQNLIGFIYDNPQNFRVTSFFGKDEVLGSYIARFFPILVYLIISSEKQVIKNNNLLLIFIYSIISFVIVMLSGERTSLMLYILCIFFLFFSSFNLRKIIKFPIIGLIIIGGIIIYSSETIKNRMISTTLNQLGLFEGSERLVLFSKTYEGHYKIAYNMFKERPLIGHGPKMFRFYCSKKENINKELLEVGACTTHPHNFYAQSLAETGIIGFSVLFVFFMYIFKQFLLNLYSQIKFKKQKLSDQAICLLSAYFLTFFPFLPSGNLFNNWLSIIIYFPLGFLIYLIRYKKYYV